MNNYNVHDAKTAAQKALFEQGAEAHLKKCLELIKGCAAQGKTETRLIMPESMSKNMVNFLIDCLKSLGFQAEISALQGSKSEKWIEVFWGLPSMIPGIHVTVYDREPGDN